MKPNELVTKIFLDSGNPEDTKTVLEKLDFLDGQTTNPSLVAKNPEIAQRFESDDKLSQEELLEEYKEIVNEIRGIISEGSISIEVYADKDTKAQDMVDQAFKMNEWIPGAHIKLPTNKEGLTAAETLIQNGLNVNLTLVFTQAQAAAVYIATKGAKKGQVFVSPFIGRLDDIELDGIDLVHNILKMYREQGDGHVEVLAASIRSLDHLLYLLKMKVDIITSPLAILEEWKEKDMPIPGYNFDEELITNQNVFVNSMNQSNLRDIDYQLLNLDDPWDVLDITHELTDIGLQRFADDWNNLTKTNS